MVRWMRSARINGGGKMPDAMAWAKDIALFVEKKGYVSGVSVWSDMFGQAGTVRWMVDHPDLATLEKVQARIATDTEYFQKIREAESKDLFLPGSIEDVVMRSL